MATANIPPGALAVDNHNGPDPFTTTSQDAQRQRYSAFDNSQFSLYLNGSPMQAKRALQAHLAETTRRLQETSHLGNALVQQRKELEDRLKEVDQQQQENDIGPELRSRLAELEKEFNEVGRETARAFLPRSRVPSGETDTTAGASVYSSEAHHSPTKISVPSRKQRNQQPSRINDIALATEISTSLLSQLKDLQAVLLEKDEALKAADLDRSQLEIEVEGLSQRLRTLDESESRLKDVNWNLETQVRESEAQSKSAADKEHRLNHALSLARSEKSTLEREFEELKQLYAKLNDDHINKTKQHETELSSLRRNVTMGETERGAMQRKVEELTTQNQELARAVAYRMKAEDHLAAEDTSPDDGGEEGDTLTPEHSPPPSPSKATPRHGMLESETLKHSLQHAHRMIQQLKNNIHREKTEKVELKRMLQENRDELESYRSLNGPGSAGKRRKNDKDIFKKPARPDRLGALRSGTQEILVEDDEWEEQEGMPMSPSRQPRPANVVPGAFASGFSSAAETSANEGFETANETSDAAFETANERDGMTTESDAFQTGAETLDGDSSDELTETEAGPTPSGVRHARSSIARGSHHDSYESTASASGDEYDDLDLRTPIQNQYPRFRLKARQGSSRRSTPRGSLDFFAGTPPVSKDSPASFASRSNEGTPAHGKSLFAELNDLSGDDDDDSFVEGTPSRSSELLSPESSPEGLRKSALGRSPLETSVPKPAMVDSGTMTEREMTKPATLSSIWSQHTQPQTARSTALHVSSVYTTQDSSPQAPPQQDLRFSSLSSQDTLPKLASPPPLHFSSVSGHATTPQFPRSPSLAVSSFSAQNTSPQLPPKPLFNFSTLAAQDTAPRAVPAVPLDLSSVSAHTTEPRAVPTVPLNISSVSTHTTEPRHVAPPSLGMSTFSSHHTEPTAPVVEKTVPPSLDVSRIAHQTTEPREGFASKSSAPATLLASAISTQSTEPMGQSHTAPIVQDSRDILPEEFTSPSREEMSQSAVTRVPLAMSSLSAHATEPKDVPRPILSAFSNMSSQATAPLVPKRSIPQLSTMSSQATAPLVPKRAIPQLSTMSSQATVPLVPKRATPQLSILSSHATEPLAPRPPPLQLSTFSSESTQPIELPKPTPLQLSALSSQVSQPIELSRSAPPAFSMVSSQITEPVEPPRPAPHNLSILSSQATEPVQPRQRTLPQVSTITAQHTEPVAVPVTSPPLHYFSNARNVSDAQPESPTLPAFLPTPTSRPSTANRVHLPVLTLSTVFSQDTEPSVPSRPITAHRTGPVPFSASATSAQTEDEENKHSGATKLGFFDSVLPWGKDRQVEPSTSTSSRDGRMPLTPISANTLSKPPRSSMADEGTQTMVSAEQIDKLLLARSQHRHSGTIATAGVEKSMSPPPSPGRRNSNEPGRTPRRPGSSGSIRSRAATPPPLPPDHKEVIAAAALKPLPPGTMGTMGPPTMPASAYKKRPQTPSIKTSNTVLTPKTGGTTPRARRHSQRGDARSGASSPISRRSSLSSFSSELDQRFNIPGGPSFTPSGIPAGTTDPRMIQAITQTMIGEYLWKYTRKTGREGMSENRHRRFFWIHPYTRTLYWSDRDPQTAGKNELKAKSVAIESVQEVDDGNPLPPGLHQKSLIIRTPGRAMKFTATTGQRHETWFNALNYLCQRVEEGEQPQPQQEQKPAATDEIQDEFNGGYRSTSRQTGRSMASYISRRTSSPQHTQVPTLRQSTVTPKRAPSTEPPAQGSVTSRFSGILRPASAMRGSFSSRRSRTSAQESTTYEEPSNSNMELSHHIHEHVEHDLDGMPNVRACCDGKPL